VQFAQVGLLEGIAAVRRNRQGRAAAQKRRQGKSHVGPVPHLGGGRAIDLRQPLPLVLRIGGNPEPAAGSELLQGLRISGRDNDLAIFTAGGLAVADTTQGSEHSTGQLRRLIQQRGGQFGAHAEGLKAGK
jgi:hypothetical protein